MAYTPMFEKLINTKPERELCLKFLKFLGDKGIVQGDINTEEIVAEFFEKFSRRILVTSVVS